MNKPPYNEIRRKLTYSTVADDYEQRFQEYLFREPLIWLDLLEKILMTNSVSISILIGSWAIGNLEVEFDEVNILLEDKELFIKLHLGYMNDRFKINPAGYRSTDLENYIYIIRHSSAYYKQRDPETGANINIP